MLHHYWIYPLCVNIGNKFQPIWRLSSFFFIAGVVIIKIWSHFFYRNHRLYETFINFFFSRILLIISLQKHFTCLQIICFSLFFSIKCHQCHETRRTKFCTILVFFFGRSERWTHSHLVNNGSLLLLKIQLKQADQQTFIGCVM